MKQTLIRALTLLFALALCLTACGDTQDTLGPGAPSDTTPAATTPADTTPADTTPATPGVDPVPDNPVTLGGPITTFTVRSEHRPNPSQYRPSVPIHSISIEHPISEEVGQEMLRYLEGKYWQNGAGGCETDYLFGSEAVSLAYSSECGTVVDRENNRSFAFSEEERVAINALLYVENHSFPTFYTTTDKSGDSVTIHFCMPFYLTTSTKTVYGPLATLLKAYLANATETGEIEPALTEDTDFLPSGQRLEQQMAGTYWIEADETLYRYDVSKHLSRVECYAGEGEILVKENDFVELFSDLWYRYPHDSYTGTYYLDRHEWDIKHDFEADTTVRFQIEEFKMGEKVGDPCSLVLTVSSDVKQRASFVYNYWTGGDVTISTDGCPMYLNGTDSVTVRLHFLRHDWGSLLDLSIGQTKVSFRIYK